MASFLQRMCPTAGSHITDAGAQLDKRRAGPIRARTFGTAAVDGAACPQLWRITESRHALLEGVHRAQCFTGLPTAAASAAFGFHHAQPAIRVPEAGLLRVIAQRLQQPRSPASGAWPAHPTRTAVRQP